MKHTDSTKAKMSAMHSGAGNPFYGRKHTAETRAKLARNLSVYRANRTYAPRPASVRIPSGAALGYLAGLIDGEGSIGLRRRTPYVTVYNTCRQMLDWLVENVGGSVGGSPDLRGREPCYSWSVQSINDVKAVLRAVQPLLIAKRDAVARVLADLEERGNG